MKMNLFYYYYLNIMQRKVNLVSEPQDNTDSASLHLAQI